MNKKTLFIVAHPNLEQSRVNKHLMKQVSELENITMHDLYEASVNEMIHVEREQTLIEEHDRIVLQFPLYWYSTPPLLKKWFDSILTYDWLFGSDSGGKLRGKELLVSVTVGRTSENYGPQGENKYTVEEFLRPIEATGRYIGVNLLPYFIVYGSASISNEELEKAARSFVTKISS